MFHDIPDMILHRMQTLEEMDVKDRSDNTPRLQRLRQIPPETGKFLALQAAMAPKGCWIEIGTSAGYSTLWLALAAMDVGRCVTTYEILPAKIELAKETFALTGVEDVVSLVEGDARESLFNPSCCHVLTYTLMESKPYSILTLCCFIPASVLP